MTSQKQTADSMIVAAHSAGADALNFARSTGVPKEANHTLDDIERHRIVFIDNDAFGVGRNHVAFDGGELAQSVDSGIVRATYTADQRQGTYWGAGIDASADGAAWVGGTAQVQRVSPQGQEYTHTFKSPEASAHIVRLAAKRVGELSAKRAVSIGQEYLDQAKK